MVITANKIWNSKSGFLNQINTPSNWSTTYPLENSSSAVVQPTQLTRSLSVLESVKESRKKLQSQFNMMAVDLQGSDVRDERLQSTHLWFVCGFKATLHVLIFAVIGLINTINIPQIFQEFMNLLVRLCVRTYIVSRGPSVFLDKSGRSKGLCLQGSEGPWLKLMMVAHGYNCACHLIIIFRGLLLIRVGQGG